MADAVILRQTLSLTQVIAAAPLILSSFRRFRVQCVMRDVAKLSKFHPDQVQGLATDSLTYLATSPITWRVEGAIC